jgi:hypothetical protein
MARAPVTSGRHGLLEASDRDRFLGRRGEPSDVLHSGGGFGGEVVEAAVDVGEVGDAVGQSAEGRPGELVTVACLASVLSMHLTTMMWPNSRSPPRMPVASSVRSTAKYWKALVGANSSSTMAVAAGLFLSAVTFYLTAGTKPAG